MSEIVVVGSANVDLRLDVAAIARPGETVLARGGAGRAPGGKGANQAVAARRLGRTTALVGRVGDDADGRWLLERLTAEGVDVAHVGEGGATTGLAVVQVDARGENSIVVAPGANAALTRDDVSRAADVVAAARVLLLQLEVPMAAVTAAAGAARGVVVLNPAPHQPLGDDLLRRVDVLVPNRGELAALAGVAEPSTVADVVAVLARAGAPGDVVVTLGADGALVRAGGHTEHVPAPRVQAVDTTGAGDAFCGALADALAGGAALVEAARVAVEVAARATTVRGAQG